MTPAPAPWAVLGDVLWCLGLGCALAAVRDMAGLLLGEGPLRTFLLDVLAFAAAAVLVFGFAAGAAAGGLARWYMSAAMLTGVLAWHQAVRRTAHAAAAFVVKIAWAPLRALHRKLIQPFRMRAAARRKQRELRHAAKKYKKTEKSHAKRLQKPSKVLYN